MTAQPPLPEGIPWPDHTVRWWAAWAGRDYTPVQWEELLTTALVHADVWSGNLDRSAELRSRIALFGGTPADGQRLKDTTASPKPVKGVTPLDEIAARRSARGAKAPEVAPPSTARTGRRRRP